MSTQLYFIIGRPKQMVHESEASLSYIVNPCLINTKGKKKRKKKEPKLFYLPSVFQSE